MSRISWLKKVYYATLQSTHGEDDGGKAKRSEAELAIHAIIHCVYKGGVGVAHRLEQQPIQNLIEIQCRNL